jgi:hypothetical protein
MFLALLRSSANNRRSTQTLRPQLSVSSWGFLISGMRQIKRGNKGKHRGHRKQISGSLVGEEAVEVVVEVVEEGEDEVGAVEADGNGEAFTLPIASCKIATETCPMDILWVV